MTYFLDFIAKSYIWKNFQRNSTVLKPRAGIVRKMVLQEILITNLA